MERVLKKIEDFLEEYPNSGYGPAHLVLGDYNLEDHHIEFCINQARGVLSGKPNDSINLDQITFFRSRFPDREVRATVGFLRELLELPLEERGIEGG